MSIGRILILLALLAGIAPAALAEVSIRSMNFPAWVERGELRVPVAPGDSLQVGDILQTGDNGRVWLQVKGGQVIKLGQASRIALERADYRGEGDDAVFVAGFNLLNGVFRYTSRFFILQRAARLEVDFRIGSSTIELDSADVYARAGNNEGQVLLLDGRIAITSPGQPAVILDEPLSHFNTAKKNSAGSIERLDAAIVESLSAETDLDASLGVAKTTGLKVLVLRSFANPSRADAEVARLQQSGYAARARAVEINGAPYTRVQLEGLESRAAAANLRRWLIDTGLIEDAWIDVNI